MAVGFGSTAAANGLTLWNARGLGAARETGLSTRPSPINPASARPARRYDVALTTNGTGYAGVETAAVARDSAYVEQARKCDLRGALIAVGFVASLDLVCPPIKAEKISRFAFLRYRLLLEQNA